MGKAYSLWECPCCLRLIRGSGLAKTSHQRKHVREGLMIEKLVKRDDWYYDFTLTEAGIARRKLELENRVKSEPVAPEKVSEI